MAPDALDQVVHLRISVAEKHMLTALADRNGLKLSQVVRQLIRKAHEEAFGPPKQTKKR